MLANTYKLGTPPFCNPASFGCSETPGYEAVSRNSEECWNGHQLTCQFNENAWKSTDFYSNLQSELGKSAKNSRPQFTWFGVPPDCSTNPCDVFMAGQFPITKSDFGSGTQCRSGSKWLGIIPLSRRQKDIVQLGAQQCLMGDPLRELTIQKALVEGQEFIKDISSALTRVANVPPKIARASLFNTWEGFYSSPKGKISGCFAVIAIVLCVCIIMYVKRRNI